METWERSVRHRPVDDPFGEFFTESIMRVARALHDTIGELRGREFLLASAAVGLSAGMTATMFYSLGVLIPALQGEFGWSRSQISLGAVFLTIALFLTGPFAGRLCDRHGAALIGSTSLAVYALGIIALAQFLGSIGQFWVAYFLISVVGAGSTPIVLVRPISVVFDRNRGLALGIVLTGAGLAGFWVPRLVAFVTEGYGWRAAYMSLAAIALLAAPLVWFGFRTVPESPGSRKETAFPTVGMSLTDARRTPQFWLLCAMALGMAVGIAGMIVHLVPQFRDLGADALTAARIASTVGLASVAGRMIVGVMLDRFAATRVTLVTLGLAALGMFLLWWAGLTYAYPAVILMGLAAGAEIDLLAYLVSRYFGPRHYSAIYGWLYGVFALGYGFSPFLVGLLREHYGSYGSALLICTLLMSISAVLALRLGPYRYGPGSFPAASAPASD